MDIMQPSCSAELESHYCESAGKVGQIQVWSAVGQSS